MSRLESTRPRERFILIIDPVRSCNLRCPSCPVSSAGLRKSHAAKLDQERFTTILERIVPEIRATGYRKISLWLYNWTEPLLHPALDEFIRIARTRVDYVGVSTNLNIKDRDAISRVLDAEPGGIKISLSGFSQEVYCVGGTLAETSSW